MPEHGMPKLIEVSKVQELISIFREALAPFPAARVAVETLDSHFQELLSESEPTPEQPLANPLMRSGKAGALMIAASQSPDNVREIAGQMLGRPVSVSGALYTVVSLPDGYNGHTANFISEPVERDGNHVKLKCAERGREYMTRWIADADLRSAIDSQVANAKAWEYRDEKEGVTFQSLDRLPARKRGQWTSERPLDAVPASLVGLCVEVPDPTTGTATKPRMRP